MQPQIDYWVEIVLNFFGYMFAVVFADLFINKTIRKIRNVLRAAYDKELPDYVPVLPRTVGFVERALYIAAIQMGAPEFIGLWITLKTASRWEIWSKHGKDEIPGRATFNIFVAGNGLSIAYAVLGYLIIYWGTRQNLLLAVLSPLALVLANVLLILWLWHMSKKPPVDLKG